MLLSHFMRPPCPLLGELHLDLDHLVMYLLTYMILQILSRSYHQGPDGTLECMEMLLLVVRLSRHSTVMSMHISKGK
jgi:hypothetical protein